MNYFDIAKRSDAFGMTSPFTEDGQFIPQVAPDVLYDWMSPEKLEELLAHSTPNDLLQDISRPHFLWRTPMGSFGYGMVSLRIKLKDGVKFVRIPHLHQTDSNYKARVQELKNQFNFDNTVFVSEITKAGYHEYYIFNGGPVHSISAGTPEQLAEMTGEANWIASHDHYQDFDLLFKISGLGNKDLPGDKEANLTVPIDFDHIIWSREGLKERLDFMKVMISGRPNGRIIFSKDIVPLREDHFTSRLNPYWSH